MLSDEAWKAKRRPQMRKAGIDERAIEYLLSLERGTVEAVVGSVGQLAREAAWEGRLALLPTGIWLRHEGGLWRVYQPDGTPPALHGQPG